MANRPRTSHETLRPREIEALSWYSRGLSMAMVADVMGIERSTVKTYLDAAQLKLAGKTKAHAVANAIRQGLIR